MHSVTFLNWSSTIASTITMQKTLLFYLFYLLFPLFLFLQLRSSRRKETTLSTNNIQQRSFGISCSQLNVASNLITESIWRNALSSTHYPSSIMERQNVRQFLKSFNQLETSNTFVYSTLSDEKSPNDEEQVTGVDHRIRERHDGGSSHRLSMNNAGQTFLIINANWSKCSHVKRDLANHYDTDKHTILILW